MKASYYCLILMLAVGISTRAGDPPLPAVVLLDDFRLLDGTVERFGGLVRISHAGQTQVVRDVQILKAFPTRGDAIQYMTDQADRSKASGCATLANWLLQVGEPVRALAEAQAALALAPENPGMQELVQRCESAVKALKPTAPAEPGRLRVTPMSDTKPREEQRYVPIQSGLAPAATYAFTPMVQPILMNACAKCHAHKDHQGAMVLEWVREGYADPAATRANLAAVIPYLNPDNPVQSPLLMRALVEHGGGKTPPIPDRAHPAYRNLETWVLGAIPPRPPMPQRPEPTPTPVLPVAAMPTAPVPVTPVGFAVDASTSSDKPMTTEKPEAPGIDPKAPQVPGEVAPATTAQPALPRVNPDDPFDPAIFNRHNQQRSR